MTDKMKNILIGLFVAAAVTIMVAMILFLEPRIGDGKKTLKVRFANVAGIVVGTRVTFAGKPVGEVAGIKEIEDARSDPSDETGRVYFYLLTLKVDSSVDVYNFDEVAIRTTGLMGEKSIAILPKAPPKGKTAHLVNDQLITANSVDPLENTFNQIAKVANRVEGAIDHFDKWFDANSTPLSLSIQKLESFLTQGDALLASANHTQIVPTLKESADLLNENLRFVRTSLDDDQLLGKIASLADNLDKAADAFNAEGAPALRNINQFTRDLSNGTGTIGRLISGEEIYLRLNSLMSKAETLMNDINHYGLLFQYDKHWQRSRTKKANFLKALDTPREFRDYFEGEVDSITTSLGRLTELLERAEGERQKIVEDDSFKKQFGSLMRTVQSLSDSIKLYNEGLVAQSETE
jgi:phospholipid/cholesterol/gamma-HCH transport system substrate-binding protein